MDSEDHRNRMEDGTGFQPAENHRLCANGCGFFGTAATLNLCSKCYRDFRIKEEQEASAKAAVEKSFNTTSVSTIQEQSISISFSLSLDLPLTESSESSSSSAAAVVSGSDSLRAQSDSSLKKRCLSCKKRVGLTGFKCRCGSTFCSAHRYPEEHACTFDFKGVGREAIAKANPVVKAEKVERF